MTRLILKKRYQTIKSCTAQKMKFFIRDFFSKCEQIRRKLRESLVRAGSNLRFSSAQSRGSYIFKVGIIKKNAISVGCLIVFIDNFMLYWLFIVLSLVLFIILNTVASMLPNMAKLSINV